MNWRENPGKDCWAARSDHWSFSVVKDKPGDFSASAKPLGGKPYDGSTIWLGSNFESLDDAEAACENFLFTRIRQMTQEQQQQEEATAAEAAELYGKVADVLCQCGNFDAVCRVVVDLAAMIVIGPHPEDFNRIDEGYGWLTRMLAYRIGDHRNNKVVEKMKSDDARARNQARH
jgi:hypothetical protein